MTSPWAFFDYDEPEESEETTATTSNANDVTKNEVEITSEKKEMDFPFPYQPYPIQLDFMKDLYGALESSCIGIFESPTGTGKSLSIICGAMKWLRDHQSTEFNQKEKKESVIINSSLKDLKRPTELKENVPDWITAQYSKKQQEHIKFIEQEKEQKKQKHQQKLAIIREQMLYADEEEERASKRLKMIPKDDEWEEYLLQDLSDSENEESSKDAKKPKDTKQKLTQLIQEAMYSSEEDEEQKKLENSDSEYEPRKIFYCSRTHTQLSQFANEVKKTAFGKDCKLVSLGSRQNLCINESVTKLKSLSRINDKCLDMQQSKGITYTVAVELTLVADSKKESSCPYYDSRLQASYRDHVLSKVQDVEELVKLGHRLHSCPYYGTRKAVAVAELVLLPYNTLLHKSTRESLGIHIEGNIVIVDEAHNLIDAINNMYSVDLNLAQMTVAHSQLLQYQEKYKNRLKAKNMRYIKQILFLITAFMKAVSVRDNFPKKEENTVYDTQLSKIMTINDFVFMANMENLNIYKIEKYFNKSEIVKKLYGFIDKANSQDVKIHNNNENVETTEELLVEKHRPALGVVESFLMALTNADTDGRILINHDLKNIKRSSLKFMLLNPEKHFTDILQQARAVILAGGTMQPTSDFETQLFSREVKREKIRLFSCGHIIPKENLLTLSLSHGPSNQELEFTHNSRSNNAVIEELGRCLLNLCNVIPDGIVCFFPSYSYEEKVVTGWTQSGLLAKIDAKKKFVREPRGEKADDALKLYQRMIENNFPDEKYPMKPRGAILSCVVGGKLSEGINFSDGLGRCVVVVGLPYPNPNDPVLKEKMLYINTHTNDKLAGQEYYENLCMKAVNQSIGRSIRHKDDYAVIVLADRRYNSIRIEKKLPKWIGSSLTHPANFGEAFNAVATFFKNKKNNQNKIEEQRASKANTFSKHIPSFN